MKILAIGKVLTTLSLVLGSTLEESRHVQREKIVTSGIMMSFLLIILSIIPESKAFNPPVFEYLKYLPIVIIYFTIDGNERL